ncbi:MAG: flagellar biosynthetic protein FliO [Terriglobales bacterium]
MTINSSAITADAEQLSAEPLGQASYSPASPARPWAPLTGGSARGTSGLQIFLQAMWAQVRKIQIRQNNKRLRVCETVPLGDRRFIAVIQVDNKQFLVGGAPNSVSLLAQLDKPEALSNAEKRNAEVNA